MFEIQDKDENFYKWVCKKYIAIKTNDMLLDKNNKILYVLLEDNDTYYDYLHGRCEVHEYSCYKELFDMSIKNKIVYDLNNLKLFNEKKEWEFYLSFEELKRIGYGYMIKDNYPLIEKYIIDDKTEFYNHFSLEQLKDFEESLYLYYETDDIDADEWGGLYSKSNKSFNNNIICLSEGLITYEDFLLDYTEQPISYEDLCLTKTSEYFRENKIKELLDYGADSDEGLYHLSSLYSEIMDKMNIKYTNIFTEDGISDGKYVTTITFEDDSQIQLDTSAWNGIKVVSANMESICEAYGKTQNKSQKNNQEFDYDYN